MTLDLTPAPIGVQTASGPAVQTDATTSDVTLVSVTIAAVSGQVYRVTGYFASTQITATGTPFVRLSLGGTEYRFGTAGNTLAYTANQVVAGNATAYYTAPSTGNVTFSIVARTSAGGIRTAANAATVWAELT
jgi:hypothetical protein